MERLDPNIVFGSERSDKVDFEIAFTAFLITIVLSFPTNDSGYNILKFLLISLSGLTLLRKMAVSNEHAPSNPVLRWTTPFIQAIILVATVYIFLEIGEYFTIVLPISVSPVVVATLIIPLFVIGTFGFHERVTKDASLYLALLSYNASRKAEDVAILGLSEGLEEWLLDNGARFVSFSNSDSIPSELAWLEHRVEAEVSPRFLRIFGIGLAGYALIWIGISWIFGSSMLNAIFLIFIFFIKYPIQFWYSRFGLARLTPDRGGWIDTSIVLIGLLVANLSILPRYG